MYWLRGERVRIPHIPQGKFIEIKFRSTVVKRLNTVEEAKRTTMAEPIILAAASRCKSRWFESNP